MMQIKHADISSDYYTINSSIVYDCRQITTMDYFFILRRNYVFWNFLFKRNLNLNYETAF